MVSKARGTLQSPGSCETKAEPRSGEVILASEVSYRRLFEAAKDGILILDIDTGRINDVNSISAQTIGLFRAEMLGKTVGELSPFKDIVSKSGHVRELQDQGYVRYEDVPLETRDGRHRRGVCR